ncbi:MAG: hypothetical protein ACYDAO_02460 [Thermoplasmataceae archaeon]
MNTCSLCGNPNSEPMRFKKPVRIEDEYWQIIASAHSDCILDLLLTHGKFFDKNKMKISDSELREIKKQVISILKTKDSSNAILSRDLNVPLDEIDLALQELVGEGLVVG